MLDEKPRIQSHGTLQWFTHGIEHVIPSRQHMVLNVHDHLIDLVMQRYIKSSADPLAFTAHHESWKSRS